MPRLLKIFAASSLAIISVLGLNFSVLADEEIVVGGPGGGSVPDGGFDPGDFEEILPSQSIPESSSVNGLILLGCLGVSLSAHKYFTRKK